MAKFSRKDARMTTAVAPSLRLPQGAADRTTTGLLGADCCAVRPVPSVWCDGPRFCWRWRREPTECHVMRQMHLNRGTVQVWRRRWLRPRPQAGADGSRRGQ